MSKPEFADRSQSRAIVLAAFIGLAGTIAAALIGRAVGEHRAESDNGRLESRLQQQEQALQALESQLAERDTKIKELSTRLEQVSHSSTHPKDELQAEVGNQNNSETPQAAEDISPDQKPVMQRFSPFEIALGSCEHIGGVLECKLVFENTSDKSANLALKSDETFFYSEGGAESRVRGASLGSHDWSANKFSAVTFEPNIPIAAKLNFPEVPSSAKTGSMKIVLGVVQGGNPAAVFLGAEPSWQSLVFKEVTLK